MKQVTKQFKNIAPEWYAELKIPLKYGQKPKNSKLNIGDSKYCIVGEIYGFSNIYIYERNNYDLACFDFGHQLSYQPILKRNNPLIVRLMSHINECHPELMERFKI